MLDLAAVRVVRERAAGMQMQMQGVAILGQQRELEGSFTL